jgi:hypothetical protein
MVAPLTHPGQSPALAALLAHAIDYAGLYLPAKLTMLDAVREYQSQRSGAAAWALGRFVLGAGQLDAFIASRQRTVAPAWPLAILSTGELARDVILMANATASHNDLLTLEAIEARADSAAAIAELAPLLALAREVYVEIPVTSALDNLVAAIRSLGARAKIRTGGVTPEAIPSAQLVARFLRACADAGVAYKATAGLHHLVRGEYPLTYEAGSARATMFGFLNVFFAAGLAHRGTPADVLVRVLEERSASSFEMSEAGDDLCWQGLCLTTGDLREARAQGLASFGSCSFREPIAELAAAGLSGAA